MLVNPRMAVTGLEYRRFLLKTRSPSTKNLSSTAELASATALEPRREAMVLDVELARGDDAPPAGEVGVAAATFDVWTLRRKAASAPAAEEAEEDERRAAAAIIFVGWLLS